MIPLEIKLTLQKYKREEREVVTILEAQKKLRKIRSIKSFEERYEDSHRDLKCKALIYFDKNNANSVNFFTVKKYCEIKITRFTSSKILMFANVSLASFIYGVKGEFCLPNDDKITFFRKNKIIKCNFQ